MSFSRGKLLLELARKKQNKAVDKERKMVAQLLGHDNEYENDNAFTLSFIKNNNERDELNNLWKQTSEIFECL